MAPTFWYDVIIGVCANIATELLMRTLPARWQPPEIHRSGGLVRWSLPSTVVTIGALFLAQHRWVLSGVAVFALVTGALLGSIAVLWAQRYWLRDQWLVYPAVVMAALLSIDASVPRFISISCAQTGESGPVLVSGRVLDVSKPVKVEYRLLGQEGHHVKPAQPADADGHWHASIDVTDVAFRGTPLSFTARISPETTSRTCIVNPMNPGQTANVEQARPF